MSHPDPSRHGRLDDRTPVLVGVATAQRAAPEPDLEPLDLMVEAAAGALRDAAGDRAGALTARLGTIAVPEGNWSYPDPARLVGRRIGADGASTIRVEVGVPQHTPIRVALERIAGGELDAALVVGAEAKQSELAATRAGGSVPTTSQPEGTVPDEQWWPQGELMAEAEIAAGIWAPVEQYACIEQALRTAEGRSFDEHLDDIARLWHRCNQVAATWPLAAFPEPRTVEFLRSPGPGNRPLASPYAKWHSTQWAVDQGAALVLCSVGVARELGIPTDRWVFPHVALESSFSLSLTKRADLHRWPAMKVLGDAAAAHLGRPLAAVEHAEIYSCFPAAVRVQQRELGLDPEGTPTIMGGMAFAGGPFNNFTYQSTSAVVGRLRDDPGSLGLVTTVSGLLTKPALAVWSSEPPAGGALVADLGDEARDATRAVEVVGHHEGPATVASHTVTWSGEEPSSAFVIADLDDGRRWIGRSDDRDLWAAALDPSGSFIGSAVQLEGGSARLA